MTDVLLGFVFPAVPVLLAAMLAVVAWDETAARLRRDR